MMVYAPQSTESQYRKCITSINSNKNKCKYEWMTDKYDMKIHSYYRTFWKHSSKRIYHHLPLLHTRIDLWQWHSQRQITKIKITLNLVPLQRVVQSTFVFVCLLSWQLNLYGKDNKWIICTCDRGGYNDSLTAWEGDVESAFVMMVKFGSITYLAKVHLYV